jgi:formimidoylglutamate deiminase
MTTHEGESTGRRLVAGALSGGARALRQPIGGLAAGRRADIVLLDSDHPDLASRRDDQWLDAWIFTAGRNAVRSVLVDGETAVETGRHNMRTSIAARYRAATARLTAS